MAQVESRFGGRYLVQDQNHMSGVVASPAKAVKAAPRSGVRQSEQSHAHSGQQGGERQRASR